MYAIKKTEYHPTGVLRMDCICASPYGSITCIRL